MRHLPRQKKNSACPSGHFWWTPVFLFSWVMLLGCGGGSSSEPAPATSAPPKPAAVAMTAPTPPDTAEQSPAKTAAPVRPAAPALTPEEQQNAFRTDDSFSNFEMLSEEQSEQFQASRTERILEVASGTNSSHFSITEEPQKPQRGTKNPQLRLPPKFVELPEFGYDASGWPLRIRCQTDNSVMAYIPAGVFIQGKDGVETTTAPQHSMFLSHYYIDLHEVTVEAFMKYRDHLQQTGERPPAPPVNAASGDLKQPALGIAWRDAHLYAQQVGKQLPTEAEWEKAARGPSGFDSPWGFGRPAWQQPRTLEQISPVMSYSTDKSQYGVFDMAGNAREWCADWYTDDAYQQAMKEAGQVPRDWTGPKKAEPQSHRVVRGSRTGWEVWKRSSAPMTDKVPDVGFRGVLRIPQS